MRKCRPGEMFRKAIPLWTFDEGKRQIFQANEHPEPVKMVCRIFSTRFRTRFVGRVFSSLFEKEKLFTKMSLDDKIIFMRMISEYFHDEEKLCQPFKHKAKRNFIILLAEKGKLHERKFRVISLFRRFSRSCGLLCSAFLPLSDALNIMRSWRNFSDFLHSWMTGRIFAALRKTSASELRCNETRLDQNVYENLRKTNFKQEENSCWFFRLAW